MLALLVQNGTLIVLEHYTCIYVILQAAQETADAVSVYHGRVDPPELVQSKIECTACIVERRMPWLRRVDLPALQHQLSAPALSEYLTRSAGLVGAGGVLWGGQLAHQAYTPCKKQIYMEA